MASLLELGQLYGRTGKLADAEAVLREAIRRTPKQAYPAWKLGALLQRTGRIDEARGWFTQAVDFDPTLPSWAHDGAGRSAPDLLVATDLALAYAPMPKCGSSTIKAILVKLRSGEHTINPHRLFANPFFGTSPIDWNALPPLFKFTIVRDPIERFLSYHARNMTSDRSLSKGGDADTLYGLKLRPSLRELILRLDEYCYCFDDVRHHTLPQAAYLDGCFGRFDEIFRFEEIGQAFAVLARHLGRGLPSFHLMRSPGDGPWRPALDPDLQQRLVTFYERDYAMLAGWYDKPGGRPTTVSL